MGSMREIWLNWPDSIWNGFYIKTPFCEGEIEFLWVWDFVQLDCDWNANILVNMLGTDIVCTSKNTSTSGAHAVQTCCLLVDSGNPYRFSNTRMQSWPQGHQCISDLKPSMVVSRQDIYGKLTCTWACSKRALISSSLSALIPAYIAYASPRLPPCGSRDPKALISPYFQASSELPRFNGLKCETDLRCFLIFSIPSSLHALKPTAPGLSKIHVSVLAWIVGYNIHHVVFMLSIEEQCHVFCTSCKDCGSVWIFHQFEISGWNVSGSLHVAKSSIVLKLRLVKLMDGAAEN